MTLETQLKNKMHAAQTRMNEIEKHGHVQSAFRYEYQSLVKKAEKCREALLTLECVGV